MLLSHPATTLSLGAIFQFSQTNFNVSEGAAEVCIDLTSGVLSTNTAIVIIPQISSTGGIIILL